MAMFEKFMDKAMNLAEAGMSKAKEVGEITKLNLENTSEEENIKKAYLEIGKLYYTQNSANPDPAYAQMFTKIGDSKAKINANKAKIAQIKADDEVKDAGCSCGCTNAEVPPEEPTDTQP